MRAACRTRQSKDEERRPQLPDRFDNRAMRPLALLVATMLLALPPYASSARARVPEAFVAALPLLRVVTFPVLLPTRFDDFEIDRAHSFVKVRATSHHYELEMDLMAGCQGQNVCSAGSLYASDAIYRRAHPELEAPPETPASMRQRKAQDRADIRSGRLILDRPTRLAGGSRGYYYQFTSGAADGGSSGLSWTKGTVRYALSTRLSNQATLVGIANSAIRNGPLFGAR